MLSLLKEGSSSAKVISFWVLGVRGRGENKYILRDGESISYCVAIFSLEGYALE